MKVIKDQNVIVFSNKYKIAVHSLEHYPCTLFKPEPSAQTTTTSL